MRGKKGISLLFMLILVLTWGSSFILMKKALVYYPSNIVAAYRMTAAFAIMLIPALIYIFRMPFKTFLLLTLSGILANGIPAFLFAYAQTGIESFHFDYRRFVLQLQSQITERCRGHCRFCRNSWTTGLCRRKNAFIQFWLWSVYTDCHNNLRHQYQFYQVQTHYARMICS